MKRAFQVLFILMSVVLISCSKSSSSPSLVGTTDCLLSGGIVNDIPCDMVVTESSGVFDIVISGSDISPNIELSGTESGGDILITPCTECYLTSSHIDSGGILTNSSGKNVLTFGFYSSADLSDLVEITVKEI